MVGPPQCRPPMNHAKRVSGIPIMPKAREICQSSARRLLRRLDRAADRAWKGRENASGANAGLTRPRYGDLVLGNRPLRRRPYIDGARANQSCFALLQRVGDPADCAAQSEQAEGVAERQSECAADGDKPKV